MTPLYQLERVAEIRGEVEPLLELHWREVAHHQDKIKLAVDWDAYAAMEAAGALHLATARLDGKLIGYCIHFLRPHPHYRNDLHAFCDIYFVAPEHRRGGAALGLFRWVEKSLRAAGVKKATFIVKTAHDHGSIFVRMGYADTEHVYTRYLGD